ncbi:RidA family protein [Maribacter sp. CXY002]|uniref:RidA family protein n=1 Tax=Maribacter luteocoastalis TaxID=3407671 RepID=UPI003B66D829
MNISERIKELGLLLPPAPPPAGLYKPVLVVDNFLYVSGQGPVQQDGSLYTGRVGKDLDLTGGKIGARHVGLTMLSTIITHFGEIDRIKRLVKTLGMVNCTPDFKDHPLVINGFSELMSDVFGPENGVGVRSAVGMMLPGNIAVEIEAMFELHK